MSNAQQAPIFFATVTQTPSGAYPSNYGGADRMVSVEIDDYGAQRIWFKDGGGFDYLQPGDVAIVEYRSNKWRFSKQQTPELIATLKQRRDLAMPPAPPVPPSPPVPAALGAAIPPANNVTPIRPDPENATTQMIRIFLELRRGLPQVSDEVIAKLACTIFIQPTK